MRVLPVSAARASVAGLIAGTTSLALAGAGAAIGSGWPGLAGSALLTALLLSARRPATAARDADLPASRATLHPVSGLDTREPLLERMRSGGSGLLGVLAFRDYDRLCAFDPEAGERVLRQLSTRLRAMLPPDRAIAHVDRGHLAIWIGGATPPEAAERELKAAVYALGAPISEGDREILPEVALRQVAFDPAVDKPDVTLAQVIASFAVDGEADSAAREVQQLVARDRFQLEQDLRQAIARGELQLHFQPLVDAGEARVCGAEALLRWQRGEAGPVPPSRFVPIIEQAGLAPEFGLWALNTALRDAAEWGRQGFASLRVAVNVSGQQLGDAALPQVIERMLARHGLGPDALEVELTESVALNDARQAARLVQELRARGVAVAIDDFGTGFSSLSTMRRLAFDKIKIDREFVTDVHRRPESQAICQSVIALGRGLGIRVLAEGVEHRAEVDWLRRHGCRYFQGFFFSPPLPSAAFTRFVADRAHLAALLATDPSALQQQIITRITA